jgi:hypothetical protein
VSSLAVATLITPIWSFSVENSRKIIQGVGQSLSYSPDRMGRMLDKNSTGARRRRDCGGTAIGSFSLLYVVLYGFAWFCGRGRDLAAGRQPLRDCRVLSVCAALRGWEHVVRLFPLIPAVSHLFPHFSPKKIFLGGQTDAGKRLWPGKFGKCLKVAKVT